APLPSARPRDSLRHATSQSIAGRHLRSCHGPSYRRTSSNGSRDCIYIRGTDTTLSGESPPATSASAGRERAIPGPCEDVGWLSSAGVQEERVACGPQPGPGAGLGAEGTQAREEFVLARERPAPEAGSR